MNKRSIKDIKVVGLDLAKNIFYVHGVDTHGEAVVQRALKRRLKAGQAGGHPWVESLLLRMQTNKAVVALANKNARMAWAVLAHEEPYRMV